MILIENQVTGEYRRADLKEDGLWHLTAGKDRLIYDVAYEPRRTREEAQAWVDEVVNPKPRTTEWTTLPSGIVVKR